MVGCTWRVWRLRFVATSPTPARDPRSALCAQVLRRSRAAGVRPLGCYTSEAGGVEVVLEAPHGWAARGIWAQVALPPTEGLELAELTLLSTVTEAVPGRAQLPSPSPHPTGPAKPARSSDVAGRSAGARVRDASDVSSAG
jgi:hypothetical protein